MSFCKLIYGDCLEVMKDMEANSIDTLICDPPYGLSKHTEEDIREILLAWLTEGDIEINKKGFMGKSWDAFVPPPTVWKECYRVLKPGGTALVFAGTRTQDLMGISLRLAGFEIFDCLAWVFGSGFPKSLNISKSLDKKAGAKRNIVGTKIDISSGKPMSAKQAKGGSGKNINEGWDRPWRKDDEHCKEMTNITAPTTPEAQLWNGWGTSLKPAIEPILCCRKPNEGSYADNALKWGVSGLWIDGGRIESTDSQLAEKYASVQTAGPRENSIYGADRRARNESPVEPHTGGRYPSNLILDSESARLLDEQSGGSKSSQRVGRRAGKETGRLGSFVGQDQVVMGHNDSGGPSRFFKVIESDEEFLRFKYQAKASKKERGDGNKHPTIKPLALMQYLCRLTKTPTGGIILDPFMGSGTTGIAAIKEGRDFIGIENVVEYIKIARKRILENTDIDGVEVEKCK